MFRDSYLIIDGGLPTRNEDESKRSDPTEFDLPSENSNEWVAFLRQIGREPRAESRCTCAISPAAESYLAAAGCRSTPAPRGGTACATREPREILRRANARSLQRGNRDESEVSRPENVGLAFWEMLDAEKWSNCRAKI